MKFVNRILASVAALLFCAAAHAQTYGISPAVQQIYFSTSGTYPGAGLPLAGGFVFTYAAGTSTPQASYSDASGFTANANPVTLGPNGTPTSGSSPVGIFLSCSLRYKIVLEDANSVVVQTTDNVSCSGNGSSGGGGTNYWTLSGSTITNNNGSGTGNVNVGANLNVGTNLFVTGTVGMADTEATPKYAYIRAPNTMTTTTTWRWPAADAAGCMTSDGAGNLSFSTTCGGGGSGSPGGSNTNIQFNNTGAFGGSGNFTWNNGSQVLTVTAGSSGTQGIINLTGFIQSENGFLAEQVAAPTTPLSFNVIQAPYGGMYALSFTALSYVQTGNHAGTPTATTSDTFNAGAMYCDTTSSPCTEKLYNGSAWVSLATGGATSPGGSNTQVQFNSSGSFGASPGLTFVGSSGTGVLTATAASSSVPGMYVVGGYMQADAGFNATPSTATAYNVIQAQGGGMYAKSFTSLNYMNVGGHNGTPPLTSGDSFNAGALYCNTATSPCVMTFYNGSAWATLGSGGGGGTPAGLNTQVQYNNSGSFGASANFTFVSSANELIINQGASSLGLLVSGGYAQTEIGLLVQNVAVPSTVLQYNAIQVPTGGVLAKSIRATNYEESGNSNGIPPLTTGEGAFQSGAHYWDTGLGAWRVYNGASWLTVSTGAGVGSLNSLSGALNITNGGTSNEITVSPSGSTIALTLPQQIGTSSNVSFGNVTSSGTFQSTVSGTSTAFCWAGCSGSINGNGAISTGGAVTSSVGFNSTNTALNSMQTSGSVNACNTGFCASSAAYQVNGSTVINNGAQWVGAAVLANGNIQTTGVFAVSGGYFGETASIIVGSCTMYFRGGILYSSSGC